MPLIRTVGLSYDLCTGLGSSLITANPTHSYAALDYEGVVPHNGRAAIYNARVFNVDVAVEVDQLLGSDADYWLYQSLLAKIERYLAVNRSG